LPGTEIKEKLVSLAEAQSSQRKNKKIVLPVIHIQDDRNLKSFLSASSAPLREKILYFCFVSSVL